MQGADDNFRNPRRIPLGLLCVLMSGILHAGGAWLLLSLPRTEQNSAPRQEARSRALQVIRAARENTQPAEAVEAAEPLPVVKTDADREQERPETPDFQGNRDARAEGETDGPQRRSDEPVPTMAGEEKEELNTMDRERQDGPIEHDGLNRPQPAEPPAPEAAPGQPDAPITPQPDTGREPTPPQQEEFTPSAQPIPEQRDGDMNLRSEEEQQPEQASTQQAAPAPGAPDSAGEAPTPPRPVVNRSIYDPTLAPHAQPGFRTTERRSRRAGQFVVGRHASVNVAATPEGRYQELIYRHIAHRWYAACDTHRGDIIPGTIIVAFRLNKRGGVENMNLVSRRGASVIQQSFTFGAIRRADLPPMPAEVQRTLIGEQMELIFTFNFD